jgi:hypothetical protein
MYAGEVKEVGSFCTGHADQAYWCYSSATIPQVTKKEACSKCEETFPIMIHNLFALHVRYIFAVPPGQKVGSSLHFTVFVNILREIDEKLAQQGAVLPPFVWLQTDNTVKEVKNQQFFACCALLVARGIIKTVRAVQLCYILFPYEQAAS